MWIGPFFDVVCLCWRCWFERHAFVAWIYHFSLVQLSIYAVTQWLKCSRTQVNAVHPPTENGSRRFSIPQIFSGRRRTVGATPWRRNLRWLYIQLWCQVITSSLHFKRQSEWQSQIQTGVLCGYVTTITTGRGGPWLRHRGPQSQTGARPRVSSLPTSNFSLNHCCYCLCVVVVLSSKIPGMRKCQAYIRKIFCAVVIFVIWPGHSVAETVAQFC